MNGPKDELSVGPLASLRPVAPPAIAAEADYVR